MPLAVSDLPPPPFSRGSLKFSGRQRHGPQLLQMPDELGGERESVVIYCYVALRICAPPLETFFENFLKFQKIRPECENVSFVGMWMYVTSVGGLWSGMSFCFLSSSPNIRCSF